MKKSSSPPISPACADRSIFGGKEEEINRGNHVTSEFITPYCNAANHRKSK
jgi:hypothetical protein